MFDFQPHDRRFTWRVVFYSIALAVLLYGWHLLVGMLGLWVITNCGVDGRYC